MNIVIVESDPFDIEIPEREMLQRVDVTELTVIKSVSQAVAAVEQLRRADVIIMEKFLPLGQFQTEQEYVLLLEKQPELKCEGGWDHRHGGEWLIRWMRKNGVNTPVILHINVDKEWVDEDVFQDGTVVYCKKGVNYDQLFCLIGSIN